MKKTIVVFIVSALLLAAAALWALQGRIKGNTQEFLNGGAIFILVGFALFIGISRLRSHLRREPSEDELSKRAMTKASSLAYYISIYLWLFVMYVSERTTMPVHSLIGAGIVGMALVFLSCWIYVKAAGLKDE
jgi:hypothetical protein